MKKEKKYRVIGVMSGTSLDGIDLTYAEFTKSKNWEFKIGACSTTLYPDIWKNRLINLPQQSIEIIKKTDLEYGDYLGQLIRNFIQENNLQIDFVSSHGHTIFHQPENNYTLQIGDGQRMAQQCQRTVICDFRSLDVSLGGQGAPLVPIGDMFLFKNYDYCLNLGGFSNVSYQMNGERKAHDICAVNIVLNDLAQKLGEPYDKGGKIAKSGKMIQSLFDQLNQISYYHEKNPKSLGREWVEKFINPLLNQYTNNRDLLHTFSEHAAYQMGRNIHEGNCLITGGGAFNKYLVKRVKHYAKADLYIPNKKIVEYKEALIFAFLGVLRNRKEVNCLSSVTGAKTDCSGGIIFTP